MKKPFLTCLFVLIVLTFISCGSRESTSTVEIEAGLLPISDANIQNSNGIAFYYGNLVTVTGVVSAEPGELDDTYFKIYMHDGSDGLLVFTDEPFEGVDIKRNDELKLSGWVVQAVTRNDQPTDVGTVALDITVGQLLTLSRDNDPPQPKTVTLAEILSDPNRYENSLLKLEGLRLTQGDWPSGEVSEDWEVTIGQDDSEMILSIPAPAAGAELTSKTAEITNSFSITALPFQNDDTDDDTYNDGFRLRIRNAEDIIIPSS